MEMEGRMIYSQINQAKAWGFSRRTPNLNLPRIFEYLRKQGFDIEEGSSNLYNNWKENKLFGEVDFL
jgi:hypothetical protein